MANVSERPLDPNTFKSTQGCARDAIGILALGKHASDPSAIIEAIDAFVDDWQQGKRPPAETLSEEDAPLVLGSLWGQQLVAQFGWQWAFVTFHDHGDSVAPGVLSPDRSLAVYPIHFLVGCLQDSNVDCTVALAFNMLAAGKIGKLKPREYFNLMDGVHRIIPRR